MKSSHWESFYSEKDNYVTMPSQFAAFIAGEYINHMQVFELGCGNGRDAFFFAGLAKSVCGIDGSEMAIDACRNRRSESDATRINFLHAAIEAPDLADSLSMLRDPDRSALVYARFFLHAITEEQEDHFFSLIKRLCQKSGDLVALEFRTHRDRDLPKETAMHFRRYIDPVDTISKGKAAGFSVEYFIEGFGFAKYRSDDAHVARLVLKK